MSVATSRTTAVRDIYVDANGLRHHLTARGNPGSPILMMVHGLTQQAHVFDGVAALLARRFHVYCLDVRGRGESEWGPPGGYHLDNYVEDLEAVRSALGIEAFALAGTSMGGNIAMYYAALHRDRVTAVVLNDIGPEIETAGRERILAMLAGAPKAFTDLKAVVKYYREANGPVLAQRSDDEVAEYARWHVRKDLNIYAWKMDQAVRHPQTPADPPMPAWEAFSAIGCPVLVIRGGISDVLGAATAAKMASARPGTTLVEVPGVGHAPSLTEPEAYAALEAFLSVTR